MTRQNKFIAGALVFIVFAFAYYVFFYKETANFSNSRTFDRGSDTAIVVKNDVEYFPGAHGYFVRPEADGFYPGVVMIHENRGLRPEIKDTAGILAKEGYMVLAVDLLGDVVETQEEARTLTAGFSQEVGVLNMRAAADYLRSQGAEKIASWGWCFGGRQSVELSISGEPLDATVVYYGGGMATSKDALASIGWPVLAVFGGEDKAIPFEMVSEFEESLRTLGVENEIYIYPGVGHAFANPSGANYAPDETMDAWEKTLDFLERALKTESSGAERPENATYTISDRPVTLTDGRADIEIVLGAATQEHVRLFGPPTYGDLDSDGDEDAVSYLQTDAGGSGTFYYVVAAINKDGRYFGTNAMFLGDRIAPQNINFIDGRAVANFADRLPGESFTVQPSQGKSVWIHFDAANMTIGEFVKNFEGESR